MHAIITAYTKTCESKALHERTFSFNIEKVFTVDLLQSLMFTFTQFFSGSLSCIFPLIAKFPNVFKFILVQMLINRFHWLHLNWFYHKIAYTELQMQSIHVSNIFKIQVSVKIFDVLSKRHFHDSTTRWLKRFHADLIFTDSFN